MSGGPGPAVKQEIDWANAPRTRLPDQTGPLCGASTRTTGKPCKLLATDCLFHQGPTAVRPTCGVCGRLMYPVPAGVILGKCAWCEDLCGAPTNSGRACLLYRTACAVPRHEAYRHYSDQERAKFESRVAKALPSP